MKIFLIIVAVLWIVGWVRSVAVIDAIMSRTGIAYQDKHLKTFVPIVLFFTWPYFYFYEKA